MPFTAEEFSAFEESRLACSGQVSFVNGRMIGFDGLPFKIGFGRCVDGARNPYFSTEAAEFRFTFIVRSFLPFAANVTWPSLKRCS